ncbi:Uncharacterised protein [Mycobacteroides abscessus subsp. abscessus]|uniref:hypothetical protein n=1 Tax=Mycobacteroides abscessus TaxID=36809 RepID=UPI000929CA52|nr:hypothetical protein [Mycobacteroides abscessus]SHZ40209.1 Uncharacterised protein [Mycobacteroides abscessus subsp. abscessus]SHZ42090.1 Uncharacterised protein [Mycobacteroides abscessus subsp. abscessus]
MSTTESSRHPSVQHTLEILRSGDELLAKHLAGVPFSTLEQAVRSVNYTAQEVAQYLNDGPELAAGLRKLLEARDCFERQARIDNDV